MSAPFVARKAHLEVYVFYHFHFIIECIIECSDFVFGASFRAAFRAVFRVTVGSPFSG